MLDKFINLIYRVNLYGVLDDSISKFEIYLGKSRDIPLEYHIKLTVV